MSIACGIRRALVASLVCMLVMPALAQNWPQRPVRLVVPYTPGGGADIVARVLGQKLAEQTGGSFVIENRPGAGGRPRAVNRGRRSVEQGPACGMRPRSRP